MISDKSENIQKLLKRCQKLVDKNKVLKKKQAVDRAKRSKLIKKCKKLSERPISKKTKIQVATELLSHNYSPGT